MMASTALPSFDPDFASPADWAAMYRACGLQAVPARYPMRDRTDKRPALATWLEWQNDLASDTRFASWFPRDAKPNMGLITGRASGNIFVVDLDTHVHPEAGFWWQSLLTIEAMGIEPETWSQVTGGGGRQVFFRAPDGWHAPTNKTPIGVDIRGQAGFAMLPPSVHLSGREYAWSAGYEPWTVPVMDAPQWLLDAIDRLVEQYGGDKGLSELGPRERTAAAPNDFDAFGARVDGREDAMRSWVWRSVLEMHRATGGVLPEDGGKAHFQESLEAWLRVTKTRLKGVDNVEGLERECRGPTAFFAKWQKAMGKWDGKIAQQAAAPRPFADESAAAVVASDFEALPAPADGKLYEFLDVKDIKAMPDPSWLVEGLVVEESLGFIFGPPGCLKTFIALGMGLSFAVGMPDWWGRQIQRQGAVIYISSEGQADLKFRIQAWELQNQVLADDSPFYLIRQTINFMSADDIGKLLATVQAIADIAGVPIAAVFVDTVSRVLPGADENLQKDMTLFVSACDAVRQRFKSTVIGVHHTSRNGNMRGSTVFAGAGDFLVEVNREEGAKHGSIRAAKIKAAADGWEQAFGVEVVSLGDISGNSSLVIAPTDTPEPENNPDGWPDKRVCRDILTALKGAWDSGKPWSSYPQSKRDGRYMPMLLGEFGVRAKVACHMMETWLANGVIGVEIRDTHSKQKGLKVLSGID